MKQVISRPYEFLVRWREGKITGAHVCFEDAIIEDGKTVGTIPGNAQAVAVAGGNGFPLSDILEQIHVDALARADALEAEKKELSAEISGLNAALEGQKQILDQHENTIKTQIAELAELKAASVSEKPAAE